MQEIGFGITREMVGNVVMDYHKDKGWQNPFANDRPGNDWWLGFTQRWPKLVERKPQHLPANRETALTEQAINAWIMKVKAMVIEAGLGDLTTEVSPKNVKLWWYSSCNWCAIQEGLGLKRGEKMFMKQVVDQAENT